MRRGFFWGLLVVVSMLTSQAQAQFDGGALQRGTISYNTSGDKTLVAGVADKTVRLYRFDLACQGANTITWKDSTPTTLYDVVTIGPNGGWTVDYNPGIVWLRTGSGKGLVLNFSASQQCSGSFHYTQG